MPYKNPEDKKKWNERNREHNNAYFRKYFSEHKEQRAEYKRRWRNKNRGSYRASLALYRAQQKMATPSWVDKKEIKKIYDEAVKQGMHVDHIVPLQNKIVCGLHVPWNLQLLTMEENCRKGNSLFTEV